MSDQRIAGHQLTIPAHTPGPWFAHGFTYPEGVAGDVFAKDSGNVLACTAICRVVEPISKADSDLRRHPLDALQAVRRKEAARPTIEANARLIAAAPDLYKALAAIMSHHASKVLFGNRQMADNAWNALAKARGEAQ